MPRKKPDNHTEKLVLLHDTVINRLKEQSSEVGMPLKNYLEYILQIQSLNKPIKKIEF